VLLWEVKVFNIVTALRFTPLNTYRFNCFYIDSNVVGVFHVKTTFPSMMYVLFKYVFYMYTTSIDTEM